MKNMKQIAKSDIFSHWVNINYLPRWGVLLLDLLITLVAFVISLLIGKGLINYNLTERLPMWWQALIVIASQGVFFWIFHTYSGILRYSTFVDTLKIALAVGANGIFLLLVNLIFKYTCETISQPFMTSVLSIYIFVAITLLFGWRVTIKTTFQHLSHNSKRTEKVLIYGTKSAGIAIAKMLQSNLDSAYLPVGFIADESDDVHHSLMTLKVYKLNKELIELMNLNSIKYVIISPLKMK